MKEVEEEQAKRRIAFGLKHKGGPKAKEASERLRRLPSGSPVVVYRTTSKTREAPFKFIKVDGEAVVIQLPGGRKLFRSTCVKPTANPKIGEQVQERRPNDKTSECAGTETEAEGEVMIESLDMKSGKTSINNGQGTARLTMKEVEQRNAEIFAKSRAEELQGLLKNGTFEVMSEENIPIGTRVFGSKFVDQVKQAITGVRYKSRLVAQNYGDKDAATIATKAPTIQRFAQRLVLSIAASMPDKRTYTRDITQAYIQSTTTLERDVYISAPKEMGLPVGSVLKVVKVAVQDTGVRTALVPDVHRSPPD